MTVGELIAELQKLPQDLPVIHDESGTSEAAEIDYVKVETAHYWLRYRASIGKDSISCGQGKCVIL